MHSTFFDKDDYEIISSKRWRLTRKRNKWHVVSGNKNIGTIYLTQLLLGKAPEGCHIDHIDGDSLNNRKNNLRITSIGDNARKVKVRSNNRISGIRGISFSKQYNTWKCDFTYNNKRLGGLTFERIEDAVYLRKLFEDYFGLEILCKNKIALDYIKLYKPNELIKHIFCNRLKEKGVI